MKKAEAIRVLRQYTEGKPIGARLKRYGAVYRLRAAGYLDATPWDHAAGPIGAKKRLLETFGDYDDMPEGISDIKADKIAWKRLEGDFMRPEILETASVYIETNYGTEIVPAYVIGNENTVLEVIKDMRRSK